MYDFDNDGHITPEDVRIMMSYMPFNRNVNIQNVQSMIDTRGMESISSLPSSPSRRHKIREGMYEDAEGKNVDYKDRVSDQEEIKSFTDNIFSHKFGVLNNKMTFK